MITIPYSHLPNTSRLFDDYCSGVTGAKQYYVGHFSDLLAFETHLQVLEGRSYLYNRTDLCDHLLAQNRRFESGDTTRGHIDLLRDERTFAVVTGQQLGLLTGPLYTIYKALTAVHHARWLKAHFPAYEFVPVFWLESEDHDLDEVRSVGLIDRENNFRYLDYPTGLPEGEKNLRPVGGISLTSEIDQIFRLFKESSTPTDFTDEVTGLFKRSYREGTTFAEAFSRCFNQLYPEAGIVFLDPSDPGIKRLYAPVIQRELETFPAAGEEVIQRSAELEESYHAQIKPRAVNLFFSHKGGRYAIEPSEYGFFLRGTRQRFEREELRAIATAEPERFSLNVLLRPIAQDTILPTVTYVAGPAEVAYFAQIQPVYDLFDVPMPIILPRASITLIEPKIQKLFDKFDIELTDMYLSPDDLYARITKAGERDGSLEIRRFTEDLDRWREELTSIAERIDANLVSVAETTISKMGGHLSLFQQKLIDRARQRDEVVRRQLEKMEMYLHPDGKLQERQLNILTVLNRFGRGLLDALFNACESFPVEHRLIHL